MSMNPYLSKRVLMYLLLIFVPRKVGTSKYVFEVNPDEMFTNRFRPVFCPSNQLFP